jgi:peptidylprolyl isomerase
MPKTPTRKAASRQAARIQQAYSAPLVRANDRVRKAAAKRRQKTGLAWFVSEFPWLSGILTVAILAGLGAVLYNNHALSIFASQPDPCAWAKHSSGPAPAGAKIVRHYSAPPPSCITDTTPGLYKATIHTARGDIVILLDQPSAPITVNNFVFLASHHFYDGLTFHRVERGILQGGDPYSANPADASKVGTGGPGYHIPDEFPKSSSAYKIQSVSMANAGSGTTGSQFFIATADDTYLQPAYNEFGLVTTATLPIAQAMQKGDKILSITITYDPNGIPGVDDVTPTPMATATP